MTRITNAMKDSIVKNALLKSGVTERLAAVKEKRFDWAEAARIETIGGPKKAAEYAEINKKAKKSAESLPSSLRDNTSIVNRRSSVYLNLAGASLTVKLRNYAEASNNREVIPSDNPLCQQFYNLQDEESSATEQGKLVEAQVRATLDKFGSVKRLLAAWPEVAELMPPETAPVKSTLPALQVADLNALVGLPSDEATK